MDVFTALLYSTPSDSVPITFKYTVKTDAYTAGNKVTTVPLPVDSSTLYPENLIVHWGDGNTTAVNCATTPISSAVTHTYATAGTYQISIETVSGKIPRLRWYLLSNGSNYHLKSIDTPFPTFYDNATTLSTLFAPYQSYVCSDCSNLVSLPNKLFKWNPQILSFNNTFSYCSSLPSLPQDLFWYNLLSLHFTQCFMGDKSLTYLHQDMFKNIVNTQPNLSLYQTFGGCSGLTYIPRLFNNCTFDRDGSDKAYSIDYTFFMCTGIVSVSPDLFYNCTYLENCLSMDYLFGNCPALVSLPAFLAPFTGLLRVSFMCSGCSSLASIPTDFFRYNTLINDFGNCFKDNISLTATPEFLLKYQTSAVISYNAMFENCPKLKQSSNLFCDEATEKTTRFATSTSIVFPRMFFRHTFTGEQGTAPELWSYTFGFTPTSTHTQNCWYGSGNSATSLTNYASIPTAWKT